MNDFISEQEGNNFMGNKTGLLIEICENIKSENIKSILFKVCYNENKTI
jgi:hypothetical protein